MVQQRAIKHRQVNVQASKCAFTLAMLKGASRGKGNGIIRHAAHVRESHSHSQLENSSPRGQCHILPLGGRGR